MASYISQIELTEEKFMDMLINPMSKIAQKTWKKWKILKLFGIGLACVMAVACFRIKDYDFALVAVMCGMVFAYQLFIQRKQLIRKKYQQSLMTINTDKWIRTITFDDKITVSDGNSSSVFQYSDCTQVAENHKNYIIYVNENIVILVEKGSFIYGDETEFLLWIKNKIL